MVAYKNISPRGTDMDFSKLERRDFLQSNNQKLTSTYFFTCHTFFTAVLTGLFYLSLSDPQDAESDSDASNTDCDIDNVSELKTKLNGWQYFMHEKLVSNLYGVSLSLKNPPFLSVLQV